MSDAPAKQPSVLDRFLGIFTEVKAGEGLSAVLLLANVFLLLTSYYVIKPVRDGLIITMPGGPEYKSYMGGAIAIALLFAVPAYASFAKKLPRNRLVVGATLFFMANLVLFAIGTQLPGSNRWLPLVFYLWVGIFNMMVVAQFWAFANDIYTEEQGERLFPLIGIGASAGAAIGGALAKFLPKQPSSTLAGGCEAVTEQVGYFDTAGMLLVSGGLLGLCALLTQVVHRRETRAAGARALEAGAKDRPAELEAATSEEKHDQRPGGAFTLVFRYRYLVLLAAFSLLFTFANTNGEYMISRVVKDYVFGQVGRCEFPTEEAKDAFVSGMFTSWYGDFYLYVNVAGVVLQSFAVSRVVKWGGLRLAFFVFPIMALLG
ncbi:MAG: hypothetical protein KC731_40020, partial [Myxococcales bacterium]|nr:hypothetical protein [Myxococcales bacterium]